MDTDLFSMTQTHLERVDRKLKLYYNKINHVAIAQCHGNKIVTFVSTQEVRGLVNVKRQTGQDILDVSI